jgi:hypothetical protein
VLSVHILSNLYSVGAGLSGVVQHTVCMLLGGRLQPIIVSDAHARSDAVDSALLLQLPLKTDHCTVSATHISAARPCNAIALILDTLVY